MIYLDYNASAPMKPAVRAAMVEAMERTGNSSSVHRYGRIARRHMEEARASVAALVGVKPTQVIFTSGGTEANATVFNHHESANVITSAIEHDSVLACVPKWSERLPVNASGTVDVVAAAEILKRAPRGSLVSLMLVNNETGIVQPVAEIADLAKVNGHYMHSDAVQAAGRMPINFAALGVDFLTLSAHKIGGPQGVGALIVSENMPVKSLLRGGGQEMNRRAGTENVAGIEGFGVAALLAADDMLDAPRLAQWRDQIEADVQAIAGDDAVIIGDGEGVLRVANTVCIAMRGVASETQVMAMDLAGVAVSAGAACSSGKVKASHVLRAMGYGDDVAGSVLRISLGWGTTADDIKRCVEAWQTLYRRTRGDQRSKAA